MDERRILKDTVALADSIGLEVPSQVRAYTEQRDIGTEIGETVQELCEATVKVTAAANQRIGDLPKIGEAVTEKIADELSGMFRRNGDNANAFFQELVLKVKHITEVELGYHKTDID